MEFIIRLFYCDIKAVLIVLVISVQRLKQNPPHAFASEFWKYHDLAYSSAISERISMELISSSKSSQNSLLFKFSK